MTIVKEWQTTINEFFMADEKSFHGRQYSFPDRPTYLFGITPEDPRAPGHHYFKVGIEVASNFKDGERAFFIFTDKTWLVRLDGQTLTPEYFYEFVEKAFNELDTIFKDKIHNTNLRFHTLLRPTFHLLQSDIKKSIDIFDISVKRNSLN